MSKFLLISALISSLISLPAWAGAKCRGSDGQWYPYDSAQCQPGGASSPDVPPGAFNPFMARAAISSAMSHVQQLKMLVTEHYLTNGEMPSSNKEMGLPSAREYSAGALQSLGVGKNGVIIAEFNERSGVRDGRLQMIPDDSKPHMGLLWKCVSPSFADIGSWMAGCEYDPR